MGRQREVHKGGTTVGQQSLTQLHRAYVWPRSMPATCPDISERLLRDTGISICPAEKRKRFVGLGLSACMSASVCFLHYVWALMCIVLFFTLAWWPGKSLAKGSEMLRRTRWRKLMDLYQAIKIDNCHSSSRCLEINPDQQGLAAHSSHSAYKC